MRGQKRTNKKQSNRTNSVNVPSHPTLQRPTTWSSISNIPTRNISLQHQHEEDDDEEIHYADPEDCPTCQLEKDQERRKGLAKWYRLTKDIIAPSDHDITEKSVSGLLNYMSEQHARFLLHLFDKEAMRRVLIKQNPNYLDSFAHVFFNLLEMTGIHPVGETFLSVEKYAWTYHLNAMYAKYSTDIANMES